jgi:3',5'-cyclic AMP phosphodiesterase CpdA
LVTQAGVTVVWETDVPFASRVDYGPTDKYGLTAGNSTPVTHHVVTLDSLKPYSQVHYRLSADGQALSEAFTFRTAASPDQPQFTFVAFGDTRSDLVAHQKVVSSILTLAPDFLLHTGDMVADGSSASDWTTFFSVERRLLAQAPMYGVLGNHEHGSPFYFEAFDFPGNGRWYSFDYGNVHFVALQIDREGGFAADSEQARWLENDLAQTHQPWKIVFFHIPPHSSALHRGDEQVRAALEPILTKYHVDLVFNGHDHDYERLMTKGIVYIVTGGGGAPLYPKTLTDPASAYFTSTHHAVWVTVNGLRLNLAGVQTDGVRFDEFALKKVSPNAPAVFVK